MSHASHASNVASNHQLQVSPICHQVPIIGYACWCTMTHPEKQDPSHKQQRFASEFEKGQRQEQFPQPGSHRQYETQSRFSGNRSRLAYLATCHSSNSSHHLWRPFLSRFPRRKFLQLKASCCLGPRHS